MVGMIPVESSNLKAVGYDETHHILYIEFKKSGTYQYINVDRSIYEGLLHAASKGFFWFKL